MHDMNFYIPMTFVLRRKVADFPELRSAYYMKRMENHPPHFIKTISLHEGCREIYRLSQVQEKQKAFGNSYFLDQHFYLKMLQDFPINKIPVLSKRS